MARASCRCCVEADSGGSWSLHLAPSQVIVAAFPMNTRCPCRGHGDSAVVGEPAAELCEGEKPPFLTEATWGRLKLDNCAEWHKVCGLPTAGRPTWWRSMLEASQAATAPTESIGDVGAAGNSVGGASSGGVGGAGGAGGAIGGGADGTSAASGSSSAPSLATVLRSIQRARDAAERTIVAALDAAAGEKAAQPPGVSTVASLGTPSGAAGGAGATAAGAASTSGARGSAGSGGPWGHEPIRIIAAVDSWIDQFALTWWHIGMQRYDGGVMKLFAWPEWRFRGNVDEPPLSEKEHDAIVEGIGAFLSDPEFAHSVMVLPGTIYYGIKPQTGRGFVSKEVVWEHAYERTCGGREPLPTSTDEALAKYATFNCMPRFYNGRAVGGHCKAWQAECHNRALETWGRCMWKEAAKYGITVTGTGLKELLFTTAPSSAGDRLVGVDICLDHSLGSDASTAAKVRDHTLVDALVVIAAGAEIVCCNPDDDYCSNLVLFKGGLVLLIDGYDGSPSHAELYTVNTGKMCSHASGCVWKTKRHAHEMRFYSGLPGLTHLDGMTWGAVLGKVVGGEVAIAALEPLALNMGSWAMISGPIPLPRQ